MLAIRLLIAPLSLLASVTLGFGQSPLTDSLRDNNAIEAMQVQPSNTRTWTPRTWTPPTEVLINDPIQMGPVETVEHLEPVELPIPGAACCDCDQAKCHGVCRDPGRPKKPLLTKPGDRDRGDCPPYRYRMSDKKRAGNPHSVAPWAACSVNSKYSAWFVGGGSPFRFGRCRKPTEGTWGLDYGGFFGYAKVWMNYTRGRNQGGEGAYETDGEPEFVSRAHQFLGIGH